MTKDWKRFEHLTQKIQQQLAPDAEVKLNEVMIGRSGARSQLDVTLRASIGQYKFFCVIECKDWARKVDIETIRAFQSKLEDVGAMQGVMVSAQGFTSEAQKFAKLKNIRLYRLVDAESEDWREAAMIPIVLGRIEMRKAAAQTIDTRTNQAIRLMDASGQPAPEEKIYLFEPNRNRYIQMRTFIQERWDEIFNTREPKPDEWFETRPGDFLLYEGNEKNIPVVIKYRLEAETTWYYGNVSLRRCLGLVDQNTGELLTSEYLTEPLIFREIIKSWPSTINRSEIPFLPKHTFLMGHFFRKRDQKPPGGVVIEEVPPQAK